MAKKYWTFKGQKLPVKKAITRKAISKNTTFNKVVRLTGRVNKRINDINIAYGKDSWSTGNLKQRLSVKGIDVIRSGRVKIPKNLSEKELKIVENALNKFLSSKTSSVKGIQDVIRKQKRNIKASLSDEDIQITDKEAETLYNFFENKDFNRVSDYIGASDLWAILQDSKSKELSEENFIKSISNYIDIGNDTDMRNSLLNIYNKYVSV